MKIHTHNPSYSPNRLLNKVMEIMGYQRDCELAEALGRDRSHIAALRNKRENLSAGWLLDLHDLTGLPANKLREMAGVPPKQASEQLREAA